jgi:hypothetical protein
MGAEGEKVMRRGKAGEDCLLVRGEGRGLNGTLARAWTAHRR